VATLGSFALLLYGPIAAQHDETITACWVEMNKFPDFGRPLSVPLWTLDAVVSAFDYCFRPIGWLLLPLAIVGAVHLRRAQGMAVVTLLAAPFLLALAAAFLHKYPFGGSRVVVFAAPALSLLIGAGVSALWAKLDGRWSWVRWGMAGLLAVLPAMALYRVAVPWSRADCAQAALFVQEHRRPLDRIATNHWEYEYYFRDEPSALLAWPARDEVPARLWVVVSGAKANDRQQLVGTQPTAQHELSLRHDFERTTVVLFERRETPSLRR
jgi:hypothetical protein